MSTGPEKKPPSRTPQVCSLVFLVAGIAAFQAVAPSLFPRPPGGGFDVTRMLAAGAVGAASAVVGGLVGTLIDSLRK